MVGAEEFVLSYLYYTPPQQFFNTLWARPPSLSADEIFRSTMEPPV